MLFYAIYPVDLASHSQSLNRYETSSINQFHLASYVGLDCVATQVLDAFHIQPCQSLRFDLLEGIEPSAVSLTEKCTTIVL